MWIFHLKSVCVLYLYRNTELVIESYDAADIVLHPHTVPKCVPGTLLSKFCATIFIFINALGHGDFFRVN